MAGKAKTYFWLKLKKDFFKSLAMKKLRKIAGGDTYTIIYLKLMLLSLENEGHLYFEGIEPSFSEELALALDEDEDNIKVTLVFLENVGLLTTLKENELLLTEVQYLTGKETDKAELMRKKRQKEQQKQLEKNTQENASGSNNVTPMLPDVTFCYTEKEREIYKPELYKPELYKPDKDKDQLNKKKELSNKNQLIKKRESGKNKETLDKIVELYNQICLSLPKAKILTETRKKKIKARLKTYSIEDFETAFKKMEASSFLRGENDRGWTANLNWLIDRDDNMAKVLEDYYKDKEIKSKAAREQEEAFRMLAEWAEEDD